MSSHDATLRPSISVTMSSGRSPADSESNPTAPTAGGLAWNPTMKAM